MSTRTKINVGIGYTVGVVCLAVAVGMYRDGGDRLGLANIGLSGKMEQFALLMYGLFGIGVVLLVSATMALLRSRESIDSG